MSSIDRHGRRETRLRWRPRRVEYDVGRAGRPWVARASSLSLDLAPLGFYILLKRGETGLVCDLCFKCVCFKLCRWAWPVSTMSLVLAHPFFCFKDLIISGTQWTGPDMIRKFEIPKTYNKYNSVKYQKNTCPNVALCTAVFV